MHAPMISFQDFSFGCFESREYVLIFIQDYWFLYKDFIIKGAKNFASPQCKFDESIYLRHIQINTYLSLPQQDLDLIRAINPRLYLVLKNAYKIGFIHELDDPNH